MELRFNVGVWDPQIWMEKFQPVAPHCFYDSNPWYLWMLRSKSTFFHGFCHHGSHHKLPALKRPEKFEEIEIWSHCAVKLSAIFSISHWEACGLNMMGVLVNQFVSAEESRDAFPPVALEPRVFCQDTGKESRLGPLVCQKPSDVRSLPKKVVWYHRVIECQCQILYGHMIGVWSYYIILYYIILYYIILHYIILYYIILNYMFIIL